MNTDEREIRQLVADWMAATKAGDVDRVLSLISEDAVFLTPGHSPMTKADFARASRSQSSSGVTIEGRSDIMEVQVFGDWGFMLSHLSVTTTPDQGNPVERTGHTLTVFNKQNNKWLLARDANLLAPTNK